MLRTRGLNLGAARAYVKERFHQAGWNRMLALLPRRDIEEVWDALILPTGWYDYPIHHAFLENLDREFRAAEPNLGRELGARAAQQDIKFYHSQTMAFVDPARILEQSTRLWSEHYSEGRIEVDDRGDRSMKLVLTNPGVHRMVCTETVPGWGLQAIRLAGARDARVEHVVCVHHGFSRCEYVVEWD
jgi:hypothetical protein